MLKSVFNKLKQVLGSPVSPKEDSSSPLSPKIHSPIAEEKSPSQTSPHTPPLNTPTDHSSSLLPSKLYGPIAEEKLLSQPSPHTPSLVTPMDDSSSLLSPKAHSPKEEEKLLSQPSLHTPSIKTLMSPRDDSSSQARDDSRSLLPPKMDPIAEEKSTPQPPPHAPLVVTFFSPREEEKSLSQPSPPTLPVITPDSPTDDLSSLFPLQEEKVDVPNPTHIPMARPGYANRGQPIPLITNLLGVNFESVHCEFFLYDVKLSYGGCMVMDKDIGRDVIKKLHELYNTDVDGKYLAYDGKGSLLTVAPLPQNEVEFTITSEDLSSYRTKGLEGSENTESNRKRLKISKSFEVHIHYCAKVPLKDIADAVSENSQEALRALNIIFKKNDTQQGCVLHQSFSHDCVHNCYDVGGCRCFQYRFKATQGGLSVNIDDMEDYAKKPPEGKDAASAKRHSDTNAEIQAHTVSSPQRLNEVKRHRLLIERMTILLEALKTHGYHVNPMLHVAGISVEPNFTQIEGRVLSAPKLKVGDGEDLYPHDGRWSFNNKKLAQPVKIERWAIVNFSVPCDVAKLQNDLSECARSKGIFIDDPYVVIDENPEDALESPLLRVEKMFDQLKAKLPSSPQFLLCLLPKKSNLYGPWKRKNLVDFGIITQCLSTVHVTDRYLTNLLLKINVKLGGMNSWLDAELSPLVPQISKAPTIILGMVLSCGSQGKSEIPSIAAVVSSRRWPSISYYRASMRAQSPVVEMIDSLFKPVSDTLDEGIVQELLWDFYTSSGKRPPDQIVIFRDGANKSQFDLVLNNELAQIIEACKFLDNNWRPKFTVIAAQKSHHTKFFQKESDNVPPGTVIDNSICHPRYNDFYLYSNGVGHETNTPTHYRVLIDEIGFTADELQVLVHSLCYVYQRSPRASDVVAPISYAHLAASQMREVMSGSAPVLELPRLHEDVRSSMFFI